MKVVTFLNQKGGVGKTSSVHHLSGTLARKGYRVLVVDNDPQASLTMGLFGPEAAEGIDPATTIAALYGGVAPVADVLRPSGWPGIDIIPGSWALGDFNADRPHQAPEGHRRALDLFLREDLAEWVAGGREPYDFALIDCPPNLNLCSWAALLAADGLVVPVQPEDYGSMGLRPVIAALDLAREQSPRIELLGYLVTMLDRRLALHKLYLETLAEKHGAAVWDAKVPRAVDYIEAITRRRPVVEHKPRGAAARAMAAVADEMIGRIAGTYVPVGDRPEAEPIAEALNGGVA